jgi:hypothetical protein
MRASASSGEAWPVWTTRRWAAQTFSTARAAGRTSPRSSSTRIPAAAVPARLTWLSASNVGNQTTRPKPPCMRHIHSTAWGLSPPTAWFSVMPPNTLMPGTCLRTRKARSAVWVTWFLKTTASIWRVAARVASSSSSRARPKMSGAAWVWKSISPLIGLTGGGGGE